MSEKWVISKNGETGLLEKLTAKRAVVRKVWVWGFKPRREQPLNSFAEHWSPADIAHTFPTREAMEDAIEAANLSTAALREEAAAARLLARLKEAEADDIRQSVLREHAERASR